MPTGAETDPLHSLRDPFAANGDQSEYDAIAELFLGESPATSAAPSAGRQPGAAAPFLETIVLGNLPGAASAWVVQYAGAVASATGGPVALVRIAEGEVSLELIGDVEAAARASSLDEACAIVRRFTSRTLLRIDGHETDLSLHHLDALTLLTGADDASVVGAYRTLKTLDADGRLADPTQIRAAIMGADEAGANRAIEQLRRAVGEFLHGHLTQAPGVHRIGPVHRSTVYRGPFQESVAAFINRFRAASTPASPATSPTPAAPAASRSGGPTIDAPTRVVVPQTTETFAPAQASVTLASRVPNLIALESRCPYHESVELAAGVTGELHALAEGAGERVGELLAVESWAKDHAKLLTKAEPALRAMDAEAALHLFADQPAMVRHLLHTRLRIHILAKPGPDGFVCLPLNHAD